MTGAALIVHQFGFQRQRGNEKSSKLVSLFRTFFSRKRFVL